MVQGCACWKCPLWPPSRWVKDGKRVKVVSQDLQSLEISSRKYLSETGHILSIAVSVRSLPRSTLCPWRMTWKVATSMAMTWKVPFFQEGMRKKRTWNRVFFRGDDVRWSGEMVTLWWYESYQIQILLPEIRPTVPPTIVTDWREPHLFTESHYWYSCSNFKREYLLDFVSGIKVPEFRIKKTWKRQLFKWSNDMSISWGWKTRCGGDDRDGSTTYPQHPAMATQKEI